MPLFKNSNITPSKPKREVSRMNDDWQVMHGTMGSQDWPAPYCVAQTNEIARKDQNNQTNASEYCDEERVLKAKMKIVAQLISNSKYVVAYCGAGLSRSSGIGDYASSSNSINNAIKKLPQSEWAFAMPTYSHYTLAALENNGMIQCLIQQNHDGLPQKANFPQHKVNAIHGDWFDPSNPVVKFSGNLRGDLFDDMLQVEEKADFVLVLGTSLSGMNADRVARTPMKKFKRGIGNGAVMINLQRTTMDKPGYSPIRVWSRLDDAFRLLSKYLKLNVITKPISPPQTSIIYCPYNEKGQRDESCRMALNLNVNEVVKIIVPEACNFGETGVIRSQDRLGNYVISFRKCHRRLGCWWAVQAKKGLLEQLPVVNLNPRIERVNV